MGDSRRVGKVTTSVVIFVDRRVSIERPVKIRRRRNLVAAYDWNQGRQR